MIVNRKNPAQNKSKLHTATDLLRYVLRRGGEILRHAHVAQVCTRNCKSAPEDIDALIAEVACLAAKAVRSPAPITHTVLSWQEGERPTNAQVEEALDIFAREMGYASCQIVGVTHRNTAHYHLHVVVNRVDTVTGLAVPDWHSLEKMHRAVARIEQLQGWKREEHGRYAVVDGETCRVISPVPLLSQGARTAERRSAFKSAERMARETLRPVFERAGSWQELHAALAQNGWTYRPKGDDGGVLDNGISLVRPSAVWEGGARKRLEKQFGKFYEAPAVIPGPPAPVSPPLLIVPENDAQEEALAAYQREREEARANAERLRLQEKRQLEDVDAERRARLEELQDLSVQQGSLLDRAFRRALRERAAEQKTAVRLAGRLSRKRASGKVRDFLTWVGKKRPAVASALRARLLRAVGGKLALQPAGRPRARGEYPDLEDYLEAVGAKRYRLMARDVASPAPESRITLLVGGPEGVGPGDVLGHVPLLQRLDRGSLCTPPRQIGIAPVDGRDCLYVPIEADEEQLKVMQGEDWPPPACVLKRSDGRYLVVLSLSGDEARAMAGSLELFGVELQQRQHWHPCPGFADRRASGRGGPLPTWQVARVDWPAPGRDNGEETFSPGM